jgi:hypothetical protein
MNNRSIGGIVRRILLGTLPLVVVLANWNDTWPGIDLSKLPMFPLIRIRSGLMIGRRTTFDGIAAAVSNGEARLRGRGKSGKPWEVSMCDTCFDEVRRGDLDGDGTQDYVIFGVGPYGNGRTAPSFSLTILLMDDDALPVPFFTVVYHGEKGLGLKHLVDLDQDGRAELLISTYDESASDPRAEVSGSGHWTTQLYRFTNFAAGEFRGTMGGIRFPFVKNWTYGSAGSIHPPVKPPVLFEHGTSIEGELSTKLRGKTGYDLWAIDPVSGCKAIATHTVVFDQERAREISFENLRNARPSALTERIRAEPAYP